MVRPGSSPGPPTVHCTYYSVQDGAGAPLYPGAIQALL
jgi:hypothetical protein